MAETAKLSPGSFVEGGGLLDDVDVIFKAVRFTTWDYNGKVPVAVPAIKATMEVVDGETVEQYWSIGAAKDWSPSEDGKTLVAVGRSTNLVSSANGAILLTSLVNAGFPEDKLIDDISVVEGLEAHVVRVPAPVRVGLKKAARADGKVFDDTVLVVGTINKLPWDKKAKGSKSGKKAGGASEDVQAKATEILMNLLAENPDGIAKQSIPGLAFKAISDTDADRNEIVKLVFDDAFLSSDAVPWTYENGTVTLG